MKMQRIARLGVACAALVALLGTTGIRNCERVTLYELRPESSVTQGCFEPCSCPIALFEELRGSFLLHERLPAAPSLFREFSVFLVQWKLQRGNDSIPITGSGRYSVGGEFASLQRLELDLRFGDGPAQHFDSGLVVGGGGFPVIDARVSVNRQFCLDTVIDVVASPVASRS
jgi:hypothetical protein